MQSLFDLFTVMKCKWILCVFNISYSRYHEAKEYQRAQFP